MRRAALLWIFLLIGGCSCEASVAMDDDAGATPDDGGAETDDGGGDHDGGGTDGGETDGGGTDATVCVDADGDGATDCEGDCDDADPLTYPGAPEICGDGVDNACGDDPDPASLCAGIGTYVSPAGDDATGDGTRENPVRSIAQGIANARTIGGPTVVVVAGGTYAEPVALVEGVSLRGGFECPSLPCSWAHDAALNESIIDPGPIGDAVRADGTITRATRLVDLSLRSPGVGLSIESGAPVALRLNVVATQGVSAIGSANPLIEDCVIVGSSTGVLLESSGELLTSDVQGSPAVYARGPVEVRGNVIHASGDTGVWIGDSAIIDGNVVNEDAARVGACSFGSCSGMAIWGGSPVITNNVVYGMGGARSAAIAIVHGELTVEEPVIHSNTLYVARAPGDASSINAGVSCRSFFGIAMFGELRNNIIVGASTGTSYGFYEEDDPMTTCRPVLIENNLFFEIDHVARFQGSPEVLFTSVSDADAEPWANANLSGDPLLDATHHLMTGSPAIDRGTATEAPTRDRDGDARPAGGGHDIGADEAAP